MKKILSTLFLMLLIFSSCTMPTGTMPIFEFNSLEEINRYVFDTIEYKADVIDFPQTAYRTMELGKGDCEDFVILFRYLAKEYLDIIVTIVVVDTGENLHSIAYAEGVYYDPTYNTYANELWLDFTIVYTFKYNVAMSYTTGFYTKGL